jgi:formylglycine-generating enzyme required for sulfatase activity
MLRTLAPADSTAYRDVRHKACWVVSVVAFLAFLCPTSALTAGSLHWSEIGDPGNSPDHTGFGAVPYVFRIGTFEVTNAEYIEFLRAVASESDPNFLYDLGMNVFVDYPGGIGRTGEPGNYEYHIQRDRGNRPVIQVSFWTAARYANWLHNGRPIGPQGPDTTDDGAYTLTPDAMAANTVERNPGARYFIPSENEWYKSAYYKGGGIDAGYWSYPTRSDIRPKRTQPPGDDNSANRHLVVRNVTDVGAYIHSPGPYGTFDQGGNVEEWNEAIKGTVGRGIRGGGWGGEPDDDLISTNSNGWFASSDLSTIGFRIATVPEPSTVALLLVGVGIFAASRRYYPPH